MILHKKKKGIIISRASSSNMRGRQAEGPRAPSRIAFSFQSGLLCLSKPVYHPRIRRSEMMPDGSRDTDWHLQISVYLQLLYSVIAFCAVACLILCLGPDLRRRPLQPAFQAAACRARVPNPGNLAFPTIVTSLKSRTRQRQRGKEEPAKGKLARAWQRRGLRARPSTGSGGLGPRP